MKVEYLSKLKVDFAAPHEAKKWTLLEPFAFKVDGELFEVPIGFWTDFASVPRFVWPLISPYDLGYGPIPHDFGYFTGVKSKEFWDSVFKTCMKLDKIESWKVKAAYHAVVLFGSSTYDGYRRDNSKHYLAREFQTQNWMRNIPPSKFVL